MALWYDDSEALLSGAATIQATIGRNLAGIILIVGAEGRETCGPDTQEIAVGCDIYGCMVGVFDRGETIPFLVARKN